MTERGGGGEGSGRPEEEHGNGGERQGVESLIHVLLRQRCAFVNRGAAESPPPLLSLSPGVPPPPPPPSTGALVGGGRVTVGKGKERERYPR